MDMETREFEVRLDANTRTIEGIAVPFNQDTTVGGYTERFVRGAFAGIGQVKLFAQHQDPIGLVTHAEETDEGLMIRAKISETPRGDEIYTLLQDGVLNKFSVGFVPIEDTRDGDVIVRTKVDLKEVSVVAFPAYAGADVLTVREQALTDATVSETNPKEINQMSEETTLAVSDLRDAVTDLERKVSMFHTEREISTTPMFRSYGDYVAAYVTGDTQARAFVDSTDTINMNAWVSEVINLVTHGRPTLSSFRVSALPNAGLNVEYPVVSANTLTSTAQANQGDLLNYGELSLTSSTAAVKTYGGYTSMSRQTIERSSVAYLDTAFRAMALGYGKATNSAVVSALTAASAAFNSSSGVTATASSVVGAITDAAVDIWDKTAMNAEFILVSTGVYKKLVTLFDKNDRPLVAYGNPSNPLGNQNIGGIQASIMGLPILIDASLASGTFYVANSNAVTTYESAGAPLTLSSNSVSTLTNDYSVYGYAAIAVPNPKALYVIKGIS